MPFRPSRSLPSLAAMAVLCAVSPFAHTQSFNDVLSFGDKASEEAHALIASDSKLVTGGLGDRARILLPHGGDDWQGGNLSFTLKVDPDKPNYMTVRLWGSEANEGKLLLFGEGKAITAIHIVAVDPIDFGNENGDLPYAGRFFYKTTPLPLSMTRGKTEVHLQILAIGNYWGYGGTFDKFQKPMDKPSRGIYRVYSSTDGYFAPPTGDKQGTAPADPPRRKSPGSEVLRDVETRVDASVTGILRSKNPPGQMQTQFLAKAYFTPWSIAHHDKAVIDAIVRGIDNLYLTFQRNPVPAFEDKSTPNPDWFGVGPAGDAVRMLPQELAPYLDKEIDNGSGQKIARRKAWADMFVPTRNYRIEHRRLYSNQSMITDLNIYNANRAVAILDPARALPESQMLDLYYQSLGLEPWVGSYTAAGPDYVAGKNYTELTTKGLTKELGFVGYYGEVLDWVTTIYDSTRPAPGKPGDPKIKAALEKITNARAPFRYPEVDAEGNRAMRAETIIGWRDAHYPGMVTYLQRASWDGSAVMSAAATEDPVAVGRAQQMFTDNQFFKQLKDTNDEARSFRTTEGLLQVPEEYELLHKLPASSSRLPMTPGQPDFVFSDEEDGCLAIKNGDEILYASLYWRAQHAVNGLARIHDITPAYDRIATMHEDATFDPSGLTYAMPDEIRGDGQASVHYPGNIHMATAGEELPIAKIPEGVKYKPGDSNVYAGKAQFYVLRYGPYLIGMNMTPDKSFPMAVPAEFKGARDLVSKQQVNKASLTIAPRSTVVLYAPAH